MAGGRTITMTVRIDGANAVLAGFRALPKEANNALRDRSQEIARVLAGRVKSAATSDSAQSALMAPTVKARRDRIPVIEIGGSSRVGSNRVPAFKVLFGSEFGSNRLKQFRPHIGRGSYWAFKTVEANQSYIADEWNKAADEVVREFEAAS